MSTYLGDNVHADMEGQTIIVSNRTGAVYLEPSTFDALLAFASTALGVEIEVRSKTKRPNDERSA